MRPQIILLAIVIAISFPTLCRAQASGNIGYGQASASARAEQTERSKRVLSRDEMPPNGTSMFVEASVLMNIKADEYVAVFGLTEEGPTLMEGSQKMDARIQAFLSDLRQLGISSADAFVDFVAQNKIYGYEVTGDIAREKVTGFEVKKNVSVHFKEYGLLDRLVAAAARSQIFDLIKVDYVVKDAPAVQDRLMEHAARIVKQKAARYQRLLGIHMLPTAQVYADKPGAYYPTEMYDSYTAFEGEDVTGGYYRQKYIVQGARKSRTFFFNALSPKGFDYVVNPVVIEPIVQFTRYLKVKYEIEQPQKASSSRPIRRLPNQPARTGVKRSRSPAP